MSHRADPSTPRLPVLHGEAALRALLHQNPVFDLETLTRIAIDVEMARPDACLTKSARRLGIGRTTLYRKLQRYGLPTPGERRALERGAAFERDAPPTQPSRSASERPRKTSP